MTIEQEFDENTELLLLMDKNITTLEGIVGELDTWLSEQEAASKGKK
ncbi:hypothetical protein PP707_03500 [Acetobacter pasteurianus]|nr:hypothetical protein [Acetobacter pasteurianus]